MTDTFETYAHYFPKIGRDEAISLLDPRDMGAFLLRPSSRPNCIVISLKQPNKILHLLVLKRGMGFGMDPEAWKAHKLSDETFPTLDLLVFRLKQLGLLKVGLGVQDIAKLLDASNAAASELSNTTSPRETVDIESIGMHGREELKKALDDKMEAEKRIADNLEHEYKGILVGMIAGQKLDSAEIAWLADWRARNHFSNDQHIKILASLNISPDQFEKMKDVKTHSDTKDICVICLDEPKSAVIVDCGHLATCVHCAEKITRCPICRTVKTKYIKVFSA